MSLKTDIDAFLFNQYLDYYLQEHPQRPVRSNKKNILSRHSKIAVEYFKNYKFYKTEDLYLLERIKEKSITCLKLLDPTLINYLNRIILRIKILYELSKVNLNQLPDEILEHIFSFLTVQHLITIRRVNVKSKKLVRKVFAQQINSGHEYFKKTVPIKQMISILKICGKKVHTLNFGKSYQGGTNLTNKALEEIARLCPNLEILDLSCSNLISTEGIQSLGQCFKLKKASFGKLWFGCFAAKNLSACTKLQELQVGDATNLGLAKISQLTNLINLDLEGCHQIKDSGVKLIALLINLLKLNLNNCTSITDQSLEHLPLNRGIQVLKVRKTQLTDRVLKIIAKVQSPNLQELDIGHTKITEIGLHYLILLPGLKLLNIEGVKLDKSATDCLLQSRMNVPVIVT